MPPHPLPPNKTPIRYQVLIQYGNLSQHGCRLPRLTSQYIPQQATLPQRCSPPGGIKDLC